MKKILIYCTLSLLIFFMPLVGQTSHSNAMTIDEPYLYVTQNETVETEDESEAETEKNTENNQETTEDSEEEPDLVMIPTFIILTVLIGILLYNFTKDREN